MGTSWENCEPWNVSIWAEEQRVADTEELDTEQTAQQLPVSVGVVKTRLHRARQALRTLLDPAMTK